ncbi:MAG: inositol monophosphatase [Rhodomicrobium sp.]|nr:inositol monophosphatase [Rhodomicrobium sp.]
MPASALMTIMINAARKAGRSLARDFGEVEHLQVSVKGPANFVSAADHRAESILYEELSRARHGYSFLMEERGLVEGPDKTHTWIIDPLDGTTNFLHGIPLFAISIALEREGELVAGLVYNPASGDLYTAERGKGAFLIDGYWERDIQAWDMAAGIVLVREAGGFVSDVDGRQTMLKTGAIVCGNEAIHAALQKCIAAAGQT